MRPATELDIEQANALVNYLRETGWVGPEELPAVHILPGGVSNRTVLVRRANGDAWVLKQALAKLRVSADWFSSPRRIHREALGLRWLSQFAPAGAITPLVFEDVDHHLLAMQAVPHPHANWKAILLAGRLDAGHVEQFSRLLGTIHRSAYERRTELSDVFADRSFFESLRLEPYYAYTATQVPAVAPFLCALIQDTRSRRVTLVHGDYSPKNILIRDGRLILLDHEVIHWGDPAFDLGFSLTHLLSKAHHLLAHRAAFADAARQYWKSYLAFAGDLTDERRAVRHTLGCLLARVAGRSPLEYLDANQRARQCDAVVKLIARPPRTVPDLVEEFIACL